MIGTIIRYGIVAIAAAIAGLSGTDAHGGIRPFRHHGQCDSCCEVHSHHGPYPYPGSAAPARRVPVFAPARRRPPIVIPPGTIGLTYRRISRLIPADEHPRTGMLEIHAVPAGHAVTITGMEGYRAMNGVWYFRTVRPLIPCTSLIRTATIPTARMRSSYRVFRLIPGRIVTMRWHPAHGRQ